MNSFLNSRVKKNLSSPWFILIGVIILFNLLLLGLNYKQTRKSVIIGQWPTPIAKQPTPTAALAEPFPSEYKTKHYNPTDKFSSDEFTYANLIPPDDNLLIKTSCSLNYNLFAGDYHTVYFDTVRQNVNPIIISYIEKLQNPKQIAEIIACTDGDKTIAFYSRGCGGGCLAASISVFQNNNILKTISVPNKIGMPYFGCRKFLELTKNSDLYMDCGGGDGPSAGSILYKLNLSTYSLSEIKSCTTKSTGYGNSHTECE